MAEHFSPPPDQINEPTTDENSAKRADAGPLSLAALRNATIYHVTTRGQRWSVHRHGAPRASGLYDTEAEAKYAAGRFRAAGKYVVVHHRDGSVKEWMTEPAS